MKFLFKQFFNMIFDGAAKVITDASAISLDIFKQDAVQSLLDFFKLLGWIILAVGILFGIANYCIERIEGDVTPLDELFMNIFKGIIAVEFVQQGAIFIFNLADTITTSIKDIVSINDKTIAKIIDALSGVLVAYSILWGIILGVIFLFMWLFVLFQALKRSGMYLMQIMVGYLYVFGMPSGNTEGILDWSRQTVALAVTNILQISSLIIALNLMISEQFFPSLVVLFAATAADKIAGRFGMSAGTRQAVGSAVRAVSSVGQVVNTFRT